MRDVSVNGTPDRRGPAGAGRRIYGVAVRQGGKAAGAVSSGTGTVFAANGGRARHTLWGSGWPTHSGVIHGGEDLRGFGGRDLGSVRGAPVLLQGRCCFGRSRAGVALVHEWRRQTSIGANSPGVGFVVLRRARAAVLDCPS